MARSRGLSLLHSSQPTDTRRCGSPRLDYDWMLRSQSDTKMPCVFPCTLAVTQTSSIQKRSTPCSHCRPSTAVSTNKRRESVTHFGRAVHEFHKFFIQAMVKLETEPAIERRRRESYRKLSVCLFTKVLPQDPRVIRETKARSPVSYRRHTDTLHTMRNVCVLTGR